jgi:hypothetical protein
MGHPYVVMMMKADLLDVISCFNRPELCITNILGADIQ